MTSPVEEGKQEEKRLPVRQMLIDWLPVLAVIVKWLVQNFL